MSNSDEITTRNPVLKWLLIFSIVIGIPSLLLSAWFLGRMQGVVNDNAEKPWSADLQRWIAHSYAYTLRPERAAESYEYASRQYARFENWELAGEMQYDQAKEYENMDAYLDRIKAAEVYERLADQYKDYPVGALAAKQLQRLKVNQRP
jgi:hypothetical protein